MLFTHRFVQHRARAIVALFLLALAAVALAACGGSSSGSGDAQTLLRQTFTGSHKIKSGKANVQLRVDVAGSASIQGPIEATIAGPFQSAGSGQLPKFDLSLDANAQGQGIRAGLISTSDQLFVTFGGTAYAAPPQLVDQLKRSFARSQQQQGSSTHTSLSALGIDPLSWLKDPTVVGTESVGGTQTDHISAKVNVAALLNDVDKLLARVSSGGVPGVPGGRVPSSLPPGARRLIEQAVKSAAFDVWSGKSDHTLRRLTLALDIAPPNGSRVRSIVLNLSVELTDLNQPQTITAPATSRPLSELLGQFQGLLGGALGATAGSGSGSSGGASSAQLNAYAKCVQRAGSNVTEAQKCAALLTR